MCQKNSPKMEPIKPHVSAPRRAVTGVSHSDFLPRAKPTKAQERLSRKPHAGPAGLGAPGRGPTGRAAWTPGWVRGATHVPVPQGNRVCSRESTLAPRAGPQSRVRAPLSACGTQGEAGSPKSRRSPGPARREQTPKGQMESPGAPGPLCRPGRLPQRGGGFHSPPCPEGRRNRCKADGESRQGNPLHLESRVTGDHRGEAAGSDSQASAHPTKRAARGHRAALPKSEGRAACTGTSQGSQQRRPQSLGLQPQHQRCALPRAEGTRGQAGPAQPSEAALHGAKPRHWEPPKGTWGCKGANGDGG